MHIYQKILLINKVLYVNVVNSKNNLIKNKDNVSYVIKLIIYMVFTYKMEVLFILYVIDFVKHKYRIISIQ